MTTRKLLISGGCERKGGFELGDGKYYEKAVLVELDLKTGRFERVVSLTEGGRNYPAEHPNLQFTAGFIHGNKLWLPTDTEIYEFELPSYRLLRVISHTCFQNIHSVHLFRNQLIATSTGLDLIVFMDASSGEIVRLVNAEGKDPWHRFDKDTDYRLVHSTRPHDCHPNYIFEMGGSLWVTRCKQEDAVNINNFDQYLDITGKDEISVHDGVIWDDKLVFTRVDGTLPMFDTATRKHLRVEDPFLGDSYRPVGWCRGLFIDEDIAYLGFSRVRRTRTADRLRFLMQRNRNYSNSSDALIVSYDMRKRKLLNIFQTPTGLIDAIYGVCGFKSF